MRKLLIIGAGGHGKVVADTAWEIKLWEEICFLDDNSFLKCKFGQVIGTVDRLPDFAKEFAVIVAVGNNRRREQLLRWAQELNCVISTIIHPHAYVSSTAEIGQGVVVFAQAAVNAFASIGFGSIINTGAVVEHDCILDDCVHISPHVSLAGGVKVGKHSWIGIGSNVIENINIGINTIVGAGSVVVNDLPSNSIIIGSPAKVIKINEK